MPMMPKSFDEVIAKLLQQGCTIYSPDWDFTMPRSRPERTTSMDFSDPQKPDWDPTPKDIEECCGVWVETNEFAIEDGEDEYMNVVPYYDGDDGPYGLNDYKSRAEFDYLFATCERIEPIPPQCVPGYEDPTPAPDWKADEVRRYPRKTEWD